MRAIDVATLAICATLLAPGSCGRCGAATASPKASDPVASTASTPPAPRGSSRTTSARLADIRSPVLVIANEHDPVFPAVGLRAVAEAVPDGRYVETPGVSHISIDPDSLQVQMTALLAFLADR